MIGRDPGAAERGRFDLVVVGGGVYGIALLLEAARRGLSPLLVERGDFGGATSWNSLRIVHGGLRSLQTLDLPRFREMMTERRWWLAHFPDLVAPLPCLMPLYGEGLRRPGVLRLALAANELLSWRRNRGVRADRAIPAARVVRPDRALALCPQLERRGLEGAALWHDAAMPDSHRLLIEMLRWAVACGAVALNYVEATGLARRGERISGLTLRDLESGRELEVDTPVVVNCAGPWCREAARRFDREIPELFHPSLAVNLLFDRAPGCDSALAVRAAERGARTYFLHPWKGKLLAGTFHAPASRIEAERPLDRVVVDRFVAELQAAAPGLELRREEIVRPLWGYLPARRPGSDALELRPAIRHHADHGGPPGLFSVSGVKFTTARGVAEATLRRIQRWRGAGLPAAGTTPRPAPRPAIGWAELDDLAETNRAAARARLAKLVEEEAAVHLGDLLSRRTDWGLDPRELDIRSRRLAELLEWDSARLAAELRRLEAGPFPG